MGSEAFSGLKKDLLEALKGDDELKMRYAYILWRYWSKKQALFEQYYSYLSLRKQFINSYINTIHQSMALQAKVGGWRTREFSSSSPEHQILIDYAPELSYKILPCEVVFEIDTLDKGNLKRVLSVLKAFDIPHLLAFSGNRGFHIHFFVVPEGYDVYKFNEHPQASMVVNELRGYLKDMMEAEIDEKVSCGHWIRCLYSLNIKGKKVGVKKPLNDQQSIPIWVLKNTVFEVLKKRYREAKERKELEELLGKLDGQKDKEAVQDCDYLPKALEILEPYKAREYTNYIAYHCPFHPPDKHSSFTFWKEKGIFKDWHDGKTYTAKQIVWKLRGSNG